MWLFLKLGLSSPFSPCCRLPFRDSFSSSDVSASEFISHKKHDICFLPSMFFKVTVSFPDFQHFLLVASAGEYRTYFSSRGCQNEAMESLGPGEEETVIQSVACTLGRASGSQASGAASGKGSRSKSLPSQAVSGCGSLS